MNIKQAFTLIELLVVIAIIGILSGLIIVSMNGITQKANIAKSQVFSNSLKNSLMMNLISEWKFDELSSATQGVTIQDSWNGNNNGILSTNSDGIDKLLGESSCVSGKCLFFDGINDHIQISGSSVSTSNLAITGAITLSAWVNFNVAGINQAIVARGLWAGNNGNFGYVLAKHSNNHIYFDTYSVTNRDSFISNLTIIDSNWHYIVATWDGTIATGGKKLYIDGKLDKEGASTISAMGQPNYLFELGSATNDWFLNGLIDDVRVFSAAISTSQIKKQYYTGLNSLYSSGQLTKEEYSSRIDSLASF